MRSAVLLSVVVALQAAPAVARTITVSKSGKADYRKLVDALRAAAPGDDVSELDQGRVGTELQPDGDGFLIKRVVAGSPADAAGLRADDVIVKLAGAELKGWTMEEMFKRTVGKPGTTLALHVRRPGESELLRVTVVRGPLIYRLESEGQKVELAQRFNDLAAALELAQDGAQKGSVKAQEYLAFAYFYGRGVDKSAKASAPWAQRCAAAGDARCEWLYGLILIGGQGVPEDAATAIRWFLKAADQNDPVAFMNLGSAYESGRGVRADVSQARSWYAKAAAEGVPDAQKRLDALGGPVQPSSQDDDFRRRMAEGQERDRRHSQLMEQQQFPAQAAAMPAPDRQPGLTADDVRRMIAESQKPAAVATPAELRSDVDAPRYKKAERAHDLAVVIGVEKYDSLPAATFAARDADAVRAHLLALGFPERNVFTLKDQQATKSAFAKELEARLSRLASADSTVFVYFSGHGAPDPRTGDAYLMPVDGDPQFLEETGYPLKRLYAKLAALRARRVVVALDSCFSGAGGRSVLAKNVRPLVAKVTVAPQAAGKVAALTAAAGSEISGTLDGQGHGLFTYFLLKGLNDGKTSLGALADYVRPKVQDEARRENRDQTPQLIGADAATLELAP